MGTSELKIFFIVISIAIAILIIGIMVYVYQYRQKRLLDIAEKDAILNQHRLDILSAQLNAQKNTAEHIGREIHDSVTQKLTLASIYLQKLQFDKKTSDDDQTLSGINNILSNALTELRALSKDLTEDLLNNNSLEVLINQECEQVNRTAVCQAHFISEVLPELTIKAKTSFLRIVQEFLQNSLKHALCNNIYININLIENDLIMELKDDGKGFDIDSKQWTGIGIEGIRRRIEMIKSTYSMESREGEGTVLKIIASLCEITANK
jgi:signal transduction histidine kinase